MRYFVQKNSIGSSALQMERRLAHIVQDQICDCVISDAALIDFVRELQEKQNEISKREPRLRRVEISADLSGDRDRGSIARVGWLRIGQISVVLYPVKTIIEL